MSRLADPPSSRITFAGVPDAPGRTRNIPVLSSSGQHSSAMDITPPPTGAPRGSPEGDRMAGITNGSEVGHNSLNAPNPAIGAAAAAQQPKVVQTAFIHKLYKYVWSRCLAVAFTNLPFETVCLKTIAFSISSLGRGQMIALSCRQRQNSPKS